MDLNVYTDGGSSGNPGPAASAYIIYQGNKPLVKHGQKIGVGTNNLAEYMALIMALDKIKKLLRDKKLAGVKKICFFADSQLMVNQINGFYKVKSGAIRELLMKVRILEGEVGLPIYYQHIAREKNQLADSLVKKALTLESGQA